VRLAKDAEIARSSRIEKTLKRTHYLVSDRGFKSRDLYQTKPNSSAKTATFPRRSYEAGHLESEIVKTKPLAVGFDVKTRKQTHFIQGIKAFIPLATLEYRLI
jgi:hypothetical protein